MYQLRNLVHRTNVPKDPEKNMDSAEDFMLLMLHTHVVVQWHYKLSDRLKAQLLWSRCINTHGSPGANIPCVWNI